MKRYDEMSVDELDDRIGTLKLIAVVWITLWALSLVAIIAYDYTHLESPKTKRPSLSCVYE